MDDGHGVIGLFSPSMDGRERDRIQVQFRDGEYTARPNFTLLHELGHYLQQNDDKLADNLIAVSV